MEPMETAPTHEESIQQRRLSGKLASISFHDLPPMPGKQAIQLAPRLVQQCKADHAGAVTALQLARKMEVCTQVCALLHKPLMYQQPTPLHSAPHNWASSERTEHLSTSLQSEATAAHLDLKRQLDEEEMKQEDWLASGPDRVKQGPASLAALLVHFDSERSCLSTSMHGCSVSSCFSDLHKFFAGRGAPANKVLLQNSIDGRTFPMSKHHMHQGLSAALTAYKSSTCKVKHAAQVVNAAMSKARHWPAMCVEDVAACFIV